MYEGVWVMGHRRCSLRSVQGDSSLKATKGRASSSSGTRTSSSARALPTSCNRSNDSPEYPFSYETRSVTCNRVGVSHFAPWGYCSSFSKEEHPLSYRLHQTTSSPSGDARPTIVKFGLHESWR